MDLAFYTNRHLAKISGFSKRQISYLTERGVIKPEKDSYGRGSIRFYSKFDLFQVFLVKTLRSTQIEYAQCTDYTRVLCKYWDEYKGLCSGNSHLRRYQFVIVDALICFVVDADIAIRSFILDTNGNDMEGSVGSYIVSTQNAESVISINLSKIISKVRNANSVI